MPGSDAAPSKTDEQQLVPSVWRPTLEAIVGAFIAGDWQLSGAPPSVEHIDDEIAQAIESSIAAYGGMTLTPLPDECWDTSVALWAGSGWQVLVDLWSLENGRTDLVLDVTVSEVDDGYQYKVHFVYVP